MMHDEKEDANDNGVTLDVHVKHEDALSPGEDVNSKQTYKSFKKKYRKMRMKFDEQMRQSNELYTLEHTAKETARRLAQQNDQLLELLLDVNNSAQIPADKRVALPDAPPLITPKELEECSTLDTPEGRAIYADILKTIEAKAATSTASRPPTTFASLLSIPHNTTTSAKLSPELLKDFEPLDGAAGPITYLTPEQLDDYMDDIDLFLAKGKQPTPPLSPEIHRNPVSVYNWLRRHEPKIFLQDGEVSEKSQGKPGSLRGAGKRASMPAPTQSDALEIVEEDGLVYDPTIAGLDPTTAKGKRKREDDGGYHPKLGLTADGKSKKPRASRKKKDPAGEAGGTPSAKKGKVAKARASSPMAVDSVNTPDPEGNPDESVL